VKIRLRKLEVIAGVEEKAVKEEIIMNWKKYYKTREIRKAVSQNNCLIEPQVP